MQHVFSDIVIVRARDIDIFGHVNNSVYMTYAEESRWNWFYANRFHENFTLGMAIVEAKIQFLQPITYPNVVKTEMFIHSIGGSSLIFHQQFSLESDPEKICAKTDMKLVFFNLQTKKSTPIPDNIRKSIETINKDME